MTLKDELFGPSKEGIYKQLATEIKGNYSQGDFYNPVKVTVPFQNWTITLDTNVTMEVVNVSSGNPYGGNSEYTRVRVPFIKNNNFQFAITSTGLIDSLAKFLGAQDIIVGDPAFDKMFTIKGNDENMIKLLFSNATIKQLLIELKDVNLILKSDDGLFGKKFPENVNELYFKDEDVILNSNKLKILIQLFSELLHQLSSLGCISPNDPNIHLT